MRGKTSSLALAAAVVSVGVACNERRATFMERTQDTEASRRTVESSFIPMIDNAMIHDMSIADMHFVPHTAELNDAGLMRLDRMAAFLDAYGGEVCYETYTADEALIEERLVHVGEYLELVGCDMESISVEAQLSGGRGMSAAQAIEIMDKGTQVQASGGGGALPTGGSAAGGD